MSAHAGLHAGDGVPRAEHQPTAAPRWQRAPALIPAARPWIRVGAFAALAAYGLERWATMLHPAPGWRLAGLLGLAVLLAGGVPVLARRLPPVAAVAGFLILLAAFPMAGVRWHWFVHLRVAATANLIGSGLQDLPNVLVPYTGTSHPVRLVVVLGAAVLLLDAAVVLALAPARMGDGRRAAAALPLTALAIVPSTLVRPQLPYLQGLLLFGLLCAFVWGERLRRPGVASAVTVLAIAGIAAALIAPRVDQRSPWVNYRAWAGTPVIQHLDTFNWNQTYGPLRWPRSGHVVMTVRAHTRDYWKAENLDTFDGFSWVNVPGTTSFYGPQLAQPGDSALRRWTQTIQVTIQDMRTNDVIAAGAASPPSAIPGGVGPGADTGTWVTTHPIGPGTDYAVSTYSPRPSPRELTAAGTAGYRAPLLGTDLTLGIPASAAAVTAATVHPETPRRGRSTPGASGTSQEASTGYPGSRALYPPPAADEIPTGDSAPVPTAGTAALARAGRIADLQRLRRMARVAGTARSEDVSLAPVADLSGDGQAAAGNGQAVPVTTRTAPAGQLADITFPLFHAHGQPVVDGPATAVAALSATKLLAHSPYGGAYAVARRLAASAATPYAFVAGVEHYLSTAGGFKYDQNPPRRTYPLESFLLRDKQGYCQQFSGAMALLLRMGGVPARVASGFTSGSYDYASHQWIVTDTDAHAWVEVWFPGYGWVRFDPTPSTDPALGGASTPPIVKNPSLPTAAEAASVLRRQVGAASATTAAPAGRRSRGSFDVWPILAGLAVAALLAVGVRRLVRRRAAGADALLDELERALTRTRRPLTDGVTLAALEQRLHSSPDAAAYIRTLRELRYGAGDRVPTAAQRRALRRELARGLGTSGRLLALWALPPRPLRDHAHHPEGSTPTRL